MSTVTGSAAFVHCDPWMCHRWQLAYIGYLAGDFLRKF